MFFHRIPRKTWYEKAVERATCPQETPAARIRGMPKGAAAF